LQGRALFTSLENATPSSAAAIYNNTETERDDDDVRSSSSRLHCGDRLSSAHKIFWLVLYTIETSQMIDGRKGTAAAEAGRRRSKNELSLELQKQNGNTNASNCDLLLTKLIASSYLLLLAAACTTLLLSKCRCALASDIHHIGGITLQLKKQKLLLPYTLPYAKDLNPTRRTDGRTDGRSLTAAAAEEYVLTSVCLAARLAGARGGGDCLFPCHVVVRRRGRLKRRRRKHP
jgi:hypothetical protein